MAGPAAITAAGGLLSGGKSSKGAQSAANGAMDEQRKIIEAQLQELLKNTPFLDSLRGAVTNLPGELGQIGDKATQAALQYDPALSTEQGINAFDQGANQSAQSDYGNAQLGLSLRGFDAGNGSSDGSGFQQDVAARRSGARGQYISGLRMQEPYRMQQMLGGAAGVGSGVLGSLNPVASSAMMTGGLNGPSGALGQQAGYYQNMANSWNPMGAISQLGMMDWRNPWNIRKPNAPVAGNLPSN